MASLYTLESKDVTDTLYSSSDLLALNLVGLINANKCQLWAIDIVSIRQVIFMTQIRKDKLRAYML